MLKFLRNSMWIISKFGWIDGICKIARESIIIVCLIKVKGQLVWRGIKFWWIDNDSDKFEGLILLMIYRSSLEYIAMVKSH